METLLRLHKTSPWHHSAWPPGLRKLPITSLSGSCDSLTSTSHWSDGLATEKVFGIQSIEKHAEHVERASIGISINRMIAVPGWPALWKHMERSSPQRRAPSSASASAHVAAGSRNERQVAGLESVANAPQRVWPHASRHFTVHEASGARGTLKEGAVPESGASRGAARPGLLWRNHTAGRLGKGGELVPSGSIW